MKYKPLTGQIVFDAKMIATEETKEEQESEKKKEIKQKKKNRKSLH